ncbi:MAG: hypothetical protein AAGG75_24645 [Bacteroidota bacterium]
MKIRIKGNSIRFRLTQSEVRQLQEKGHIGESTRFGPTADALFQYRIDSREAGEAIGARYCSHTISVLIPEEQIAHWASSAQVSLRQQMQVSATEQLDILIEKDFKCLTDRPGEDESDHFPHPKEHDLKC